MALTKEEATSYIAELEEKVKELNEEIIERPTRTVVEVNEVVVENSQIGGDIGGLAKALSVAQGEFTSVKKGSKGHGYSYADIEAVLTNSLPIISKLGLSITQMNVSKMMGKVPLVGVKTILMHESGGWVSGEVYIPTVKTKMNSLVQMAGVNMTYLRRYGIQSALGLATTDSDGV